MAEFSYGINTTQGQRLCPSSHSMFANRTNVAFMNYQQQYFADGSSDNIVLLFKVRFFTRKICPFIASNLHRWQEVFAIFFSLLSLIAYGLHNCWRIRVLVDVMSCTVLTGRIWVLSLIMNGKLFCLWSKCAALPFQTWRHFGFNVNPFSPKYKILSSLTL